MDKSSVRRPPQNFVKEQLQKSNADLEAKNLEGLKQSKVVI